MDSLMRRMGGFSGDASGRPPKPRQESGLNMRGETGAPPIFNKEMMDKLAEMPPLPIASFPDPTFTRARKDKYGRRMPQSVAHRGYKAKFPENTMAAFEGAVEIGVHGLETDVHLSSDGIVVLSHDVTLQRCFGVDKKIVDCDWKYLSELRTLKPPHEQMPRLEDLIRYLAQPELVDIWLMLDIKIDNDADTIMKMMSEVVNSVPPPAGSRWEDRIILGCWAAKYIPLCHKYFPNFPVTNIGFSILYSRQFMAVRNVSFNLLQACLISPSGRSLLRDLKIRDRPVYAWTVNDESNMDWCIRRSLDCVITDEPKKFLEICEGFNSDNKPSPLPWMVIFNFIRINVFAWVFGIMFWRKYRFSLDKRYLE